MHVYQRTGKRVVVKGEVLDSVGPKHDVGGGEDCTVCGWGGINFLHSSLYAVVFWICE